MNWQPCTEIIEYINSLLILKNLNEYFDYVCHGLLSNMIKVKHIFIMM
jgi:hypothetical protein